MVGRKAHAQLPKPLMLLAHKRYNIKQVDHTANIMVLITYPRISTTATSLTFVPVGPVMISPPTAFSAG